MKKTATATPDGHGGFNIVFNDPKTGVMEAAVKLGFSVLSGSAVAFGTWLMNWGLEKCSKKKEEAKDKA